MVSLGDPMTDEFQLEFIGLCDPNRGNTENSGECRDRRSGADVGHAFGLLGDSVMRASSRDRISVDLCGLKSALFERAQARGVSPSGLMREALVVALGQSNPSNTAAHVPRSASTPHRDPTRARLTLRMSREEAAAALAAAQRAGLNPGAFVAGLVAGIPAVTGGSSRTDHVAALVASSAELATLSRSIFHMTRLMRQGNVEAARPYREMLDRLDGDVRTHLMAAGAVLADLQPRRADHQAAPGARR